MAVRPSAPTPNQLAAAHEEQNELKWDSALVGKGGWGDRFSSIADTLKEPKTYEKRVTLTQSVVRWTCAFGDIQRPSMQTTQKIPPVDFVNKITDVNTSETTVSTGASATLV